MSNFRFLETEWAEFYQRAAKAEKLVITDPRTSLTYARMALELAVNWMFQHDMELELPHDTSLNSLMNCYEFRNQFSAKLYGDINLIRKVGNLAIHNKPVTSIDADHAIVNLFYFAKWFATAYASKDLGDLGLFDYDCIPQQGEAALNKKQLELLQNKFDKELNKFQEELKITLQRNKELEEKNELYKKQVEKLQAQIAANKNLATQEDEQHHPRNERETRIFLIDVLLREAGWNLKGANDKEYMVKYMPLSTNKSGIGYVDYVLWDDDGKPLAVVEAKKTLESVTKGENQAQLYADSLEKMFGRRPAMFYTNGFEIYFWDDQFYKKSRPVHGFYSKQELQTLMFRRTNRKDIRTHEIDTEIAGRHYQMRSIKSIAEHFAGTDKRTKKLIGTNRGALLVLATGTGKTRVAISFSKLMLEANWAKRILFLADRISLVNQAKANFVKFLPEHSSVSLLEDKENSETRFVFSTYQTMMGLIDEIKNGDERFYGIGHFDLIIIDEAHRSIYQKYQAIFEYFDALLLGLTATPKNNIDKNTYEVFGLADKKPTDAYPFDEAVANRHLVPYRSIEVPTKFQTKGIKYSELSAEEKAEFEKEILDGQKAGGNERVDKEALNKWLFNKNSAVKTLSYILKNSIKKRGGDEPGKTIIFARNQKHAHFLKKIFLDLDKELYGNDYVKVITHSEPKAEEFIRRFCDDEVERLPQIAISVDMMDTGIDAPSVVNLVFYKPVKSYSKFWQMIGRGSRLRPDLFGLGKDKERFLIFDLCGNFEFFEENPHDIETGVQKGLCEIVFNLKLHLAHFLYDARFAADEQLCQFAHQLLDELHGEIASLDRTRFDVRMKMKLVLEYGSDNRELWNHLDAKDLKKIEDHLSGLVIPQKGDIDLARFYDKLLYALMIKRLETVDPEAFMSRYSTTITKVAMLSKKLLKKTTIPEVKKKVGLIKLPLEENFWKMEGIAHFEQIREGVRDLIKYIDPDDQKYVVTDFKDDLDEQKVKTKDYVSEPKGENTSPFTSNIHRLETVIRQNKNHIAINRIRSGEQITQDELRALEVLLFNGKVKKEELENELGKKLDLVSFIIDLIGLSEEKVDASFAQFINDYQLSSVQISFLSSLKAFFTKNGKIDPEKLYDKPFKDFHTMAIDGIFNEKQADQIFEIVTGLNQLHKTTG
jgi:type I restriction enzyme R subunit